MVRGGLAQSASQAAVRPSTADGLRRSASEQVVRKRELFSAPSSAEGLHGTSRPTSALAAKLFANAPPIVPAQSGWNPPSLFRLNTPPAHCFGRKPQLPGKLTSEDYGLYLLAKGFQPGVRQREMRGIKPVSLPTEHETRGRARPKSAIVLKDDTPAQAFTLRGTRRSS